MKTWMCHQRQVLQFALLLTSSWSTAHEGVIPVIVDTDMALDDARALVLLLNAPGLRVEAVVTSDGACPPDVGATNVFRILHTLNRTRIPVGAGRPLGKPAPPWAGHSSSLGGSELPLPAEVSVGDALTVLRRVLRRSPTPVVWFGLGPLSNLAGLLQAEPGITNHIRTLYYCGQPPDADRPGWNTLRDMDAARQVFGSGLDVIASSVDETQIPAFDAAWLESIAETEGPAAELIVRMHSHPEIRRLAERGHLRIWDESLVLLFHHPWLGRFQSAQSESRIHVVDQLDAAAARRLYLGMLRSGDSGMKKRPLVTLREFPSHPDQFQPDLQPLMSEIQNRHGLEEWNLNVLTSELHRHLGLYSILGAKMGLRARELLGASLDELEVESLAGLHPPVSCLNDGLQVSTGATLGRGTIRVAETSSPQAAAWFTDGQRRLLLRVREDALRQVQQDLRAALQKHGDLTPDYFAEVRRIALQAWLDLDRRQVFDESFLATGPATE